MRIVPRSTPDAVVIGAGPNGLVAANLLADHGWSVTVLEEQPEPGGAVRSAELVEPGFVSDVFSSFYPLAAASPAIRQLELERHGLRWQRSDVTVAHPNPDGSCAIITTDLDRTAESLESFAPGDGEAWRRLYELWERVGPAVMGLLTTPLPPVRSAAGLLGRLGPAELARLARLGVLGVRRLGQEEFCGAGAQRLLAGNALHADLAPEQAPSAIYGWVLCALAQQVGFPVPEGGAGRLTEALVARLRDRGGELICGRRAEAIIVRRRRAVGVRCADGDELGARRAVLADVDAPQLYRELIRPDELTSRVRWGLQRFQFDNATVKVDWTLNGPIPWDAPQARRAGTVHIADDVDHLTRHTAELTAGLVPSRPYLVFGQYAPLDRTRMPPGKEVAWAYTHLPQRIRGDASGDLRGIWDQRETDEIAHRIEAEVERLAPGFRQSIRGRHVLTPDRFQGLDRNLVNGALNGGTAQLHQQLIFRPVLGWGRSETPVRRLYLCSAAIHPGGGVHGGCGAAGARAALAWDAARRRSIAMAGTAAATGVLGAAARRSSG